MPISEAIFLEILKNVGAEHLPLEDAVTEHIETVPPVAPVGTSSLTPIVGMTAKNFWGHYEAHPVLIHALLSATFGQEWLGWESETFAHRISEEFPGAAALSALNLSKIEACRTLLVTDGFWEAWEVFLACCMPFNNEPPDFAVMQVPTVAQVLVACMTAAGIRTGAPAWSEELKAYITTVYVHDGIWKGIRPAAFVTPHSEGVVDLNSPSQLARVHAAESYLAEDKEQLLSQLRLFHAQ